MPIDMNVLARLGAQTRIRELIAEIESLAEAFPGLAKAPAHVAPKESSPRNRRRMSAAIRAKLKAAWARRKAAVGKDPQSAPEQQAEAPSKKRTLSAAGRAKIAAAQRKRWAAIRKGKKKG